MVEDVATRLTERGERMAVVETCTGGQLVAAMTSRPGASEYFDRAFVPYAADAHRDQLGVQRELLDDHGIVSARVTRELARRARDMAGVRWGLATNGIAGPGGGTEEKPVGTAFMAVAVAEPWGTGESGTTVSSRVFSGDRREVNEAIVLGTLRLLRRSLDASAPSEASR